MQSSDTKIKRICFDIDTLGSSDRGDSCSRSSSSSGDEGKE